MKKMYLALMLAGGLALSAPTAHAAETKINIDGTVISSDAKAEMKNGRTMVPVRVISENLGATVGWSGAQVTLTMKEMKLTLTPGSNIAIRNGEQIKLDAKPYLENGRVFVPLRFIAEAFDSEVLYAKGTVTINTKPVLVNGVRVKAVQNEYRMIIGGYMQKVTGNRYVEAAYNTLMDGQGEPVEAPEHYSWMNTIDTLGSYYKNDEYHLLGVDGKSLGQYDVYTLIRSFPDELLTGYPEVVLHDVAKDQWYLFSTEARQALQQLFEKANNNGFAEITPF